jgi:carbamate kinase
MAPKIDAVCNFVEATGRRASIGSLDELAPILAGRAGTTVYPDAPRSWYHQPAA